VVSPPVDGVLSGVAAGTLTDFPALVKLSADINGFDYADFADPGAADLRFVNRADGAELVYEVEQWNPAGTSFIWVRIPALSQGTIVDAYWGNTFASTPAYVSDGSVWQSSYLGVWHLHDDLNDATAAGNHGTGLGNDQWDGVIANAEEFDGINDGVRLEPVPVPSPPPLGATNITLSAWIWRRGDGATVRTGSFGFVAPNQVEPILAKGQAEQDGTSKDLNYFFGIRPGDQVLAADLEQGAGGTDPGRNEPVVGTTPVPTSSWTHATVTYDGTWRLYMNGQEELVVDPTASGASPAYGLAVNEPLRHDSIQPAGLSFAFDANGQRAGAGSFNGAIDEARIENVVRGSNWIHAAWLNVASNTQFNGYGTAALVAPGAPRILTGTATNVTFTSAWVQGTLVSTGSSATAVSVFWGPSLGGTNPAAWYRQEELGLRSLGNFSTAISGLTNEVTYYVRCRASNATAIVWSPNTAAFTAGGHVNLTVAGSPLELGNPSPYGYGTFEVPAPAAITNSVDPGPHEVGSTRYVLDGWVGTGSVPATGSTHTVAFALTATSALTWQWGVSEYLLTVDQPDNGAVVPATGWQPAGEVTSVQAVPGASMRFGGWTGDVPAGQTNDNPVALLMDAARTISPTLIPEGTLVDGVLQTNWVWTSEGNPYVVTDAFTVPAGITLSMEPGVHVQIFRFASLDVRGTVRAVGTATEPIRVNHHPSESSGGWIELTGTDTTALGATGVFVNCVFDGLSGPIAALNCEHSSLTIADSTFLGMPGKVMRPLESRITFVRNVMHSTGEGVNVVGCAGVLASNRVFNILGNADALDVDNLWPGPGDGAMVLEWNELEGAQHSNADAIDVSYSDAIIRNNTMRGFSDKGISLGPLANVTIHNNLIENCNIGIQIKDSSDPEISHNTIVACTAFGINSYIKGQGPGGPGLGSGTNNIIWDCGVSIFMEDGSTLDIQHSLIQGTSVWTGVGNVTNDPQFMDSATGNYRLSVESPAVDAATALSWLPTAVDLDERARVYNGAPDMGAYEYQPPVVPTVFAVHQLGSPTNAGLAGLVLSWQSSPGEQYELEFTTNLIEGWQTIVSNLTATPPGNVMTTPAPTSVQGFYRVR
jgi:parallel beta-helix repeat protein